MSPLPDPWFAGALALDVMLASHAGAPALAERRKRRLDALLAAARRCMLYRERFARHGDTFEAQPPVAKTELMERFDDWVCDARLTLPALRRFVADPARIGQPFAGEFTVWESSGSSGVPGIFVQDETSMVVYDALEALRRPATWRRWLDPLAIGERVAFVGATDGHFASAVSIERMRRKMPWVASRMRGFSFLLPTEELTSALNAWRPTIVATYPTAALMLAEEAAAGRLKIAPVEIWTGGESLSDPLRALVERAFGCKVQASYGASEFLALASDCALGRLHLNSDWAILEPVDERYRPVPAGDECFTTLLTNLVNTVQPLIRYDLGDRVRIDESPCACGSALPVIEVEGRVDDALLMRTTQGGAVRLLPLALTGVLEEVAGVFDFQLVQHGPRSLQLTLAGDSDAPAASRARVALMQYLELQGLGSVQLEVSRAGSYVRGRSGKIPRVVQRARRGGRRAPDPGA